MIISDETLTEIHTKVYKKHKYSTFQNGLRAFVRGRRWAKENDKTAVPPAGIADKLLLWAEINSLIQAEVIRLEKEEKKNAENKKTLNNPETPRIIKVSGSGSGN